MIKYLSLLFSSRASYIFLESSIKNLEMWGHAAAPSRQGLQISVGIL